jgi:hypothetical protein
MKDEPHEGHRANQRRNTCFFSKQLSADAATHLRSYEEVPRFNSTTQLNYLHGQTKYSICKYQTQPQIRKGFCCNRSCLKIPDEVSAQTSNIFILWTATPYTAITYEFLKTPNGDLEFNT